MSIRTFVNEHYRHFNAGALAATARSLTAFLNDGGRLFVTLPGVGGCGPLGDLPSFNGDSGSLGADS